VPTVILLADEDPARIYPLALAEELVRDFTCVKGVQAVGLRFNEYYAFGRDDPLGTPPNVAWLVGAIDVAARYGRFIAIELDELGWPRVMANAWRRPLYDAIRAARDYVVPVNAHRGPHTIPQSSALMGLWLEGAVAQWGIGARSSWYVDAHFLEPGVSGVSQQPHKMPPSVYRAMILNGALTGATVYTFAPGADLWFGRARHHWDEAIHPTLSGLLGHGLIARKDFVRKKAKVAYQLGAASTARQFHANLRDIDGVLDQGLLIHGAYGMERPGQVSELIPNTGRHYWVPLLSPHASPEAVQSFERVVHPGEMASAAAWTVLLDQHHAPDGEGTAFISRVGRGVFVLNTRENAFEEQTVRLTGLPAPVRGLEAHRTEQGVELTWPLRAGDVSYKVHRRVLPRTRRVLLADDVDRRRFTDASADPAATIAYAVTALTSEKETYEGRVGYGEYRAFSVVESRVAEEVVLGPLLGYAKSQPVSLIPPLPRRGPPPWPNLEGAPDDHRERALAVAARIEAWDAAFRAEDLEGVLGLYLADYEDPQGWRFPYVRRAYQWFFERYGTCRMARQIRRWDFSSYDATGQVDVLLYCRFEGVAFTDPSGRFADVTAHFPRTPGSEVWVSFSDREGPWRIARTNPALPNFRDILSFGLGPDQPFAPGPDPGP